MQIVDRRGERYIPFITDALGVMNIATAVADISKILFVTYRNPSPVLARQTKERMHLDCKQICKGLEQSVAVITILFLSAIARLILS